MTSKFQRLLAAVSFCLAILSASKTNAGLIDQGATIYDSDVGISWLKNANLAATIAFGVSDISASGAMSWDTAQKWIDAMNTGNYLGHNHWRLPITLQPDESCSNQNQTASGGFCTGSEMAHLFYTELGGSAGSSITTTHNPNFGLFAELQPFNYWSGTAYAPDAYGAWVFGFDAGDQNPSDKLNNMYVWALRSGQAENSFAVPIPPTYALILGGLIIVGFTTRPRGV